MDTRLPDFYRYLLYPAIPAITFTVLMGALLKGSANSNHEQGLHPNHRLPIPEIIVLAGFLIIPILAVLVARLYTGAYEGRYGLPAVVGLAGLFSLGASALWRRSAIMGPVLLLLFVAVLTEKNIVVAKNFLGRSAPPSADAHVLSYPLVGEDLLEIAIDRGQPIAINHFQPFLEFDYYASPKLASSMFLLTNPEAAGAYTGQSMFDSYAEGASMWFPIRGRIEKYSEFVGSHKRFLVYHKPWGTDWLVRKLLDDGARLELIKTAGLQGLYQVVFEEPPGTRAKQPPFAR